jgi:hypothetical protein
MSYATVLLLGRASHKGALRDNSAISADVNKVENAAIEQTSLFFWLAAEPTTLTRKRFQLWLANSCPKLVQGDEK